jgi:hypothetical protein
MINDNLSESSIQISVVKFLERFARPEIIWFAVPNGDLRHPRVAMRLKSQGVKPGVPDLHFLLPGGKSVYIEMKRPKGGVESPDQIMFKRKAYDLGHEVHLCTSLEQAFWVFQKYDIIQDGVTLQ